MITLNQITAFAALMLALSLAVERTVEILKGMFPILRMEAPNEAWEGRRRAVLQLISVLVGTVVAYFAESQIVATVTWFKPGITLWILVGFMASGGSAMWNHILDIVGAIKVEKEKLAAAAVVTMVPEAGAAKATAPSKS